MKVVGEFKKLGVNSKGMDVGVIMVDDGFEVHECKAYRFSDGEMRVGGFVGRYRTGAKLWACNFWVDKDGDLVGYFGRDEVSSGNSKSGVSYNPEVFEAAWKKEYKKAANWFEIVAE